MIEMQPKQVNLLSYLNETCPICHQEYDELTRIPMMLCYDQHLSCKQCTQMLKKLEKSRCPQCRKPINKQTITIFRRLYKVIQQKKDAKVIVKSEEYKSICKMQQKIIFKEDSENLKRQRDFSIQNEIEEIKNYKIFKDNQLQKLQRAMLNQAVMHFNDMQIKRCINVCQIIIENNPHQSEIFLGLGSKEQSIGYYQQSQVFKWFQQKQLGPKISCYDLLGLCFLFDQTYKQAKLWYQKMISTYPNNMQLLYGLALTEFNAGKTVKPEQIFLNIIKLEPNFSKSYQMLAFIELKRKQYQKMKSFAQKCLEKEKDNIFAKFLLVYYVYLKKQKKQSFDQLDQRAKRIIELQPSYARIYNLLGLALAEPTTYKLAIQYFEQSIKMNGLYVQPIINKSKSLVKLSSAKQALFFMKNKYNTFINNAQFQLQTAQVFRENEMYAKSINCYELCYKLKPTHVLVNKRLASLYLMNNQYLQAIKIYQRDLKYNRNQQTYESIVVAYQHLKDYQHAIVWAQRWIKVAPNQEINLRIAKYYIQLEKYSQALQKLYRCIEKKVSVDIVYPQIIKILNLQKKYEQAIKQAKKWIVQSPGKSQSWLHLSIIYQKISQDIKQQRHVVDLNNLI